MKVTGSIDSFLAQRRIAVAGVSRSGKDAGNFVYRKLRDTGYDVTPVNPSATELEGVTCYPTLHAVPYPIEAVVIATAPSEAEALVRECKELGITKVWMHRSFGTGSVSAPAVDACRENGIEVIVGGCPLMFCSPVDLPHRCMKFVLHVTGRLPE